MGLQVAGIQTRQICYALASFLLGVWAFKKVNSISGPAFEPILAACTNPDISAREFANKTQYHEYEPLLGLGAFNVLVCLITQFLLELRETYPAGVLTWGGVVVVSLPATLLSMTVAGRKGAKGPIRYPTVLGLLYQLFGVSVMFPLVFNPSFILGGPIFGVPITKTRILAGTAFTLPIVILTYLVFSVPTDNYLWTVSAGILGGPIIALMGLTLWTDKSSSLEGTSQNITKSNNAIQKAYSLLATVGFLFWLCLVAVAYKSYGFAFDNLWRDIWTEAGPSVAFMTIDTGVLYLGILIFIAYESEWKALKVFMFTPFLGPACAVSVILKEIELEAATTLLAVEKKDI